MSKAMPNRNEVVKKISEILSESTASPAAAMIEMGHVLVKIGTELQPFPDSVQKDIFKAAVLMVGASEP